MNKIYLKYTNKIGLIIILHLCFDISVAQKQFEVVYGGNQVEQSRKVIQTVNSEYIVLGMTKSYGAGNYDISLTRLDINGKIIWSKTIGTPTRDGAYNIKKNPAGGYIIASIVINDPPTYDDWNIMSVDENGNILSEIFFGGDHDEELMDIELTQNDEYILAGNTWSFANSLVDICIARMDQDLNFLWTKTFEDGVREYSRSMTSCSDGNFIIIGGQRDYNDMNNRILIFKIDENGNLVWSKKISGSNEIWGWDIAETNDGDFIAVGYTNSFGAGSYDIYVNKINTEGSLIWAKTYGGSNDDKAYEIKEADNGSYFISGSSNSFGAGGYDALLLNIDIDGNVLGANTFGGEYDEGRSFLEKTNDGGIILASVTKSYGSGDFDNFIIKTDENGNSCCNSEVTNLTVNAVSPEISTVNFTSESDQGFPTHYLSTDEIILTSDYICIDSLQIIGEDTVCAYATGIPYTIYPNILIDLEWILPDGANISQSLNDTTVFIDFGGTSGYIYIQTTECNEAIMDSIYVYIGSEIEVDLGNDTLICSDQSFLLDPGVGYTNYTWQDGSTDSSFTVNTSGIYWVEVTDQNGCSGSDTIQINLYPTPEIDIGNDTLLCLGDSIILNAAGGYSSYLWSTGSTDSSIVVNTAGMYNVEVVNEFGCSAIDSILVQIYPVAFEDLELGADTSFCPGEGFVLNAGAGYTLYQWQNGSSDSIFIADTAGVYWVYVENPCSSGSDTIVLDIFPQTEINLGSDTSVCFGESIILDPGFGFESYLWQDGSSSQYFYANQTGFYWVQIVDENSCLVYDTINLDFILPNPDIGSDTAICSGDSITFFASDGFVSYLWQNGSEQLSLTTGEQGLVWCEVMDTIGCLGSDSLMLDILFPPDVSLGNDTAFCIGDSLWLSVSQLGNAEDIVWQDGSDDSTILVWKEGEYWVMASNACGSSTDTVLVSVSVLPWVYIGNDTILAMNTQIELDAGVGFKEYFWCDGCQTQTITISEGGSYWVNVFDGLCYNSDTIYIEPIECELFIPIVFTPNGDGSNDYFYAETSKDITDFELIVFNRWGEKIWETQDKEEKWNGQNGASKADEGTYFWVLKYKCLASPIQFEKKGSVTLLR